MSIHLKTITLGSYKSLNFMTGTVVGSFFTYIVVFLLHRNISTMSIGAILTLNSLAALIAQPFWGMLSDKLQSIKKVYLLCITAGTVLVLLLPLCNEVWLFFVMFPLTAIFFCAVMPLMDSWTIQGVRENRISSYGPCRLWMSIGYAAIVALMGKLVNQFSADVIFIACSILSAFTIITCISFKSTPVKTPDRAVDKSLSFRELPLQKLFKNYYYITFLLAAFLLYFTLSPLFNFLPALMKKVGGNDELFGLAVAISALSEIPVFLFSKHLVRKFKPVALILTGIGFFLVRQYIYSTAGSPLVILLTQTLHGISYGLFATGSVYYIDSLAPDELKSTAQTAATAIYSGLGGIVGNFAAGSLISSFGIFFVFRLGMWIDAGTLLLFGASLVFGKYAFARRV